MNLSNPVTLELTDEALPIVEARLLVNAREGTVILCGPAGNTDITAILEPGYTDLLIYQARQHAKQMAVERRIDDAQENR